MGAKAVSAPSRTTKPQWVAAPAEIGVSRTMSPFYPG
jgi:hypothetical protein